MDKFERDLYRVYRKMRGNTGPHVLAQLRRIKRQLVKMHRQGLVKVNHSAMEMVCARHLLELGYSVEVEHRLNDFMVCDVYGVRGSERLIVEIETGFVPPEHAVDPRGYIEARTISKIARYSAHADVFALAMPPFTLLPLPRFLLQPPQARLEQGLAGLKNLCDNYYTNPPIGERELLHAKLDRLLYIDVDTCEVIEVEPRDYLEFFERWAGLALRRTQEKPGAAPGLSA